MNYRWLYILVLNCRRGRGRERFENIGRRRSRGVKGEKWIDNKDYKLIIIIIIKDIHQFSFWTDFHPCVVVVQKHYKILLRNSPSLLSPLSIAKNRLTDYSEESGRGREKI